MPESFGARLRRRREEQQIALSTIAEQTKIKRSLLEALERDDVSHWPSGIFRRAYIRAYAAAIGLAPDSVLREFLELYPEPPEVDAAALALARDGSNEHAGPPTRLRYLVGSAIGSLSRRGRNGSPPPAPPDTLKDARPADAMKDDPPAAMVKGLPPVAAVKDVRPVAVACTGTREADAFEPDLAAVAELCTKLARVDTAEAVPGLLQEAAALLDASGLIVWLWDPGALALRPALVHGYSAAVLAHVPPVKRDADNATAAAFRSGQVCALDGGAHGSAALVVPLLTPGGCAGVLALELPRGRERQIPVRAISTIVAALLAQLLGGEPAAEVTLSGELCAGA